VYTASLLTTDALLFRAFGWRGLHRTQFLSGGVFSGRRIETAVLLFLPVFVAVRMFTDIPLLL
jgi:hypothetical protein